MAAASDYLEDALLDHVLGGTTYTQPATIYLALYTDATTDAGGGTEVTGGSYARQTITFGAASAGSASNNADVDFASMPTATVTNWAILDAASGGNMLFHGAFSSSVAVTSGDTFRVASGNLTLTAA